MIKIVWVTHCPEQHPECYHYSVFMKFRGRHFKLAQLNDVKYEQFWKIPIALFKQRKNILHNLSRLKV